MPDLACELHDQVLVVTLNRPDARNAMTRDTHAELERVVRTTSARCLVVTGADPAFCAGDDVKRVMSGASAKAADAPQDGYRLTPAAEALLMTDVPIVAAVNGAAMGWGMELAITADIRVASDRATFGELFVKRGLCSDAPGIGRLAQLVGREGAADLLFTGRVIDAAEAHRMGLVSRVVPHAELLKEALNIASTIASNPPLAVQRMKAGMRRALDPDWQALGAWISESFAELFQTQDHKEGLAAYLEKREPQFIGR